MILPETIGPFVLDKSPTTMQHGYYYCALLDVPFSKEKRAIRVWLPDDYFTSEKEYPVMYFADGQNLVNQNLCTFGCWRLDQVAYDNSFSFIAVGVDSPRDAKTRFQELNPPYNADRIKDGKGAYGDKFINYIADELVPLINQLFKVSKKKEETAIAGSSMGGIMAFYAGVICPDTFGFSLDFSPAFFLFKEKTWDALLKSFNLKPSNKVRYFFYVGGKGFESQFVDATKATYQYLKSLGFDEKEVALLIDPLQEHNEDAWHQYLKDGLSFWLKQ